MANMVGDKQRGRRKEKALQIQSGCWPPCSKMDRRSGPDGPAKNNDSVGRNLQACDEIVISGLFILICVLLTGLAFTGAISLIVISQHIEARFSQVFQPVANVA